MHFPGKDRNFEAISLKMREKMTSQKSGSPGNEHCFHHMKPFKNGKMIFNYFCPVTWMTDAHYTLKK
jgi:hypothetical protein